MQELIKEIKSYKFQFYPSKDLKIQLNKLMENDINFYNVILKETKKAYYNILRNKLTDLYNGICGELDFDSIRKSITSKLERKKINVPDNNRDLFLCLPANQVRGIISKLNRTDVNKKELYKLIRISIKDLFEELGKVHNKKITRLNSLTTLYLDNYNESSSQQLGVSLSKLQKSWENFLNYTNKYGMPKYKIQENIRSIIYNGSEVTCLGNERIIKNGSLPKKVILNNIIAHRPIEGKIKTVTIINRHNDYFISYQTEKLVQKKCIDINKIPISRMVGIDPGSGFGKFNLSDGTKFPDRILKLIDILETKYSRNKHKIDILRRKASKFYEKRKSIFTDLKKSELDIDKRKVIKFPGESNLEHIYRVKIAELELDCTNLKKNLFCEISKYLTDKYDFICIEGTNISELVEKKKYKTRKELKREKQLRKNILSSSWYMFRNILESTCKRENKIFRVVSSEYTSQSCPWCGLLDPSMKINTDTNTKKDYYDCQCGCDLHRDTGAAINILNLGYSLYLQELKTSDLDINKLYELTIRDLINSDIFIRIVDR